MSPQPDPNEFLPILEKNKGIIYKVSRSYCKDEEDRKDLFQEIIYQLWRSYRKYDDQYKLSTWIYRISLNVAITFYRKDSRRKENHVSLTDRLEEMYDDTATAGVEKNISLLEQFIHELPELDRALMILYLEEKSHKEMAEVLGITETNVATKIGRIKDKLKQKFSTIKDL